MKYQEDNNKIFSSLICLNYRNKKIHDFYIHDTYKNKKYLIVSISLVIICVINFAVLSYYSKQNKLTLTMFYFYDSLIQAILTICILIFLSIQRLLKKKLVRPLQVISFFNVLLVFGISRDQSLWGKGLPINSSLQSLISTGLNVFLLYYVFYFENSYLIVFLAFTADEIIVNSLRPTNSSSVYIASTIFYVLFYVCVVYVVEKKSKEDFFHKMYIVDEANQKKEILDSLSVGILFFHEHKLIDLNNIGKKRFMTYNDDQSIAEEVDQISFNKEDGVNVSNSENLKDVINAFLFQELELPFDDINYLVKEHYLNNNLTIDVFTQIVKSNIFEFNYLRCLGVKKKTKENSQIQFQIFSFYNVDYDKIEFIINDISVISKMEEVKLQMRYKTLFLSKTTHEFKNPLFCVIELLKTLELKYFSKIDKFCHNSKLMKKVNNIQNLCNYMLILIKDFDFLSITNYDKSINYDITVTKIELEHLIAFCIGIFKTKLEFQKKILTFNTIIHCEDHVIYTDEVRLKQILINLLSNSFKFTNNGSIDVIVKDKNQDFLKITVKDTGKGIPSDKISLIGKPFSKFDHTNNDYGAGLGMSIVLEMIAKLGENFKIKSKVGEGTKITFWLKKKCVNKSDHQSNTHEESKSNQQDTLFVERSKIKAKSTIYNPNNNSFWNKDNHLLRTLQLNNNKTYNHLTGPIEMIIPSENLSISCETKKQDHNFQIAVTETEKSLISKSNDIEIELKEAHEVIEHSPKKLIRIILVEDEKLLRKASKKILQNYMLSNNIEYDIIDCTDGAECLFYLYNAFTEGKQYDIVLSDLNMNFIGGNFLLETIEALICENVLRRDFKFYLVTAELDLTLKQRFSKFTAFQDMVCKPLSTKNVERILKDFI